MSFNGSGTYTLPAGQPVVTGTVISSTTFNTLTSDLATALTNTICKDGQSTPTANIPMGGFKLTGLGAATAATDSARLSTVQNSQGQILGTIAGTNTITAQATPTLTAYASGQTFRFAAAGANTGATTLNIDSLGAKNIFWNGSACTGGEIGTGAFVTVTYDGTQFNLASSSAVGSNPFSDTNALVKNAADATKLVKFSAASVSASTTRTVTIPDKSGTMAMTSDVAFVQYAISGSLPTSITGNATTGAVTISSGQATDTTFASCFTSAGFSWAVSNGNAANGYRGGTTLPNSSTIHFFLMATNSDTSWSASFADTSITPTLPGSYTKYRRIFSLQTTGAGALIPINTPVEIGGGAMLGYLTTQVLDVNVATLGSTRTAYTLSVPTGIKVQPLIRAAGPGNVATTIILTSGDETDVAPSGVTTSIFSAVPGFDGSIVGGQNFQNVMTPILTTNTSGQIGARAGTSSTLLTIVTRGWIDYRRA